MDKHGKTVYTISSGVQGSIPPISKIKKVTRQGGLFDFPGDSQRSFERLNRRRVYLVRRPNSAEGGLEGADRRSATGRQFPPSPLKAGSSEPAFFISSSRGSGFFHSAHKGRKDSCQYREIKTEDPAGNHRLHSDRLSCLYCLVRRSDFLCRRSRVHQYRFQRDSPSSFGMRHPDCFL
jgi:hypothetical protein